MAQAKQGDQVKVHYTGKLDNGEIFDSSVERTPLEFSIGKQEVIPGFEEAVIGMSPGDSKTVKIPSEEAYGPYYEELVMVIEREQIPPDLELEVGQQLQIQQETGQTIPVIVRELSEDDVTLDANHPLAGEDLTFEIELVAIH
ncbi:FKBP-type peptidyl-prolyl cis-trans isomerase [Gloeothece verrucosa]|uniref:Peptidyl-prolyl cis-trans isomerase n=1 Tax=Gloeothece verrucosa (strain PCC 7822) TaxID=497965 RepID=E0UEJ9_GLOV7|nr:peptidylprolyl isomerase [Gloeothece verrucosa]ADN16567.1 peptidylprolyl isomerase FKBP-type [Gloeothece verrucosa PCC 7822]